MKPTTPMSPIEFLELKDENAEKYGKEVKKYVSQLTTRINEFLKDRCQVKNPTFSVTLDRGTYSNPGLRKDVLNELVEKYKRIGWHVTSEQGTDFEGYLYFKISFTIPHDIEKAHMANKRGSSWE